MINVGIGECVITKNEGETLITHALGSCVALIVHDAGSKHTAMAHIVLPKNSSSKCYENKPGYFAVDVVPKIVGYFTEELNCRKSQLKISLIGGADAHKKDDVFLVGEKNIAMIHHLLCMHGVKADFTDIGGHVSRTVSIDCSTGELSIRRQKMIL